MEYGSILGNNSDFLSGYNQVSDGLGINNVLMQYFNKDINPTEIEIQPKIQNEEATVEPQIQQNPMQTTVGDLMKDGGLANFGKSLTVGNLLGLWNVYKQNQLLNKQMDAMDQNMKIAKKSYNAKVKTLNNARERSKVVSAALGDREYKAKYDDSEYETV